MLVMLEICTRYGGANRVGRQVRHRRDRVQNRKIVRHSRGRKVSKTHTEYSRRPSGTSHRLVGAGRLCGTVAVCRWQFDFGVVECRFQER